MMLNADAHSGAAYEKMNLSTRDRYNPWLCFGPPIFDSTSNSIGLMCPAGFETQFRVKRYSKVFQ